MLHDTAPQAKPGVTVIWHYGSPQTANALEPADVKEPAEALALDRFQSWVHRGGGPHVLACAALLPDQVWSVATFASLAPFTTEFDWFAGMTGGGPSLRASPARARDA